MALLSAPRPFSMRDWLEIPYPPPGDWKLAALVPSSGVEMLSWVPSEVQVGDQIHLEGIDEDVTVGFLMEETMSVGPILERAEVAS